MKNTEYYDKEGRVYSTKRYPAADTDYTHFFFKKRLKILLSILRDVTKGGQGLSLIEIGCADGIVSRAISDSVGSIEKIVGIDISEKMIESARAENQSPRISFFVRGQEDASAHYDIVVEVGVVNLTDRFTEYRYASDHLKSGGYYICSLASNTSLRSRFKFEGSKEGFAHILSYPEYEAELKERFEIVRARPYGLFIPLIWKTPALARLIQPAEAIVSKLVPGLFHEKIYLLKKKN